MSVYANNTYNKTHTNEAWAKIFGFVPGGNKTVLDIGCSSGKLGAALIAEKKVTVDGADISREDVKLAKANLRDAWVLDVERDSLDNFATYDVVVMADVIEHLVDPVAALKKIKKILKPGGRLVFSIPNMANVTIRLNLLKGRFEYKDFGLLDRTHLHFYDSQEVNRVFREAGFEVKKTDCTTREIPHDILSKQLSAIGIDLTDKLEKIMNAREATIYQFIGYAVPATGKAKPFNPESTSPLDAVSEEIDRIIAEQKQIILDRDASIRELTKERDNLAAELKSIHESRGWKLLTKAYTAKQKISRK